MECHTNRNLVQFKFRFALIFIERLSFQASNNYLIIDYHTIFTVLRVRLHFGRFPMLDVICGCPLIRSARNSRNQSAKTTQVKLNATARPN